MGGGGGGLPRKPRLYDDNYRDELDARNYKSDFWTRGAFHYTVFFFKKRRKYFFLEKNYYVSSLKSKKILGSVRLCY